MKTNNKKQKDFLKETKFYKKHIKRKEKILKNLFKIFILKLVIILLFSGFATVFALHKIKYKFIPIISEIDYRSVNINITGNNFESFIVLISVISVFLIPLTINFKNIVSNIKLVMFVIIFFFGIAAYIVLITNESIGFFIKLVVYSTISYIIWLIIDLILYIYNWLWIPKEKTKQIDVAKLTLIWAIIVFLLNFIL